MESGLHIPGSYNYMQNCCRLCEVPNTGFGCIDSLGGAALEKLLPSARHLHIVS